MIKKLIPSKVVKHTVVERFLTSNKMFLAKSDLQRSSLLWRSLYFSLLLWRSLFARNILLEVKKRSTTVCYQLRMLSTVSGGEPSFVKVVKQVKPKNPYVTHEIESDIKAKRAVLRRMKKHNTVETQQHFKQLRNRVTHLLRKSERAHVTSLFPQTRLEPSETATKTFWQHMKQVQGNRNRL